MSDRDKYARILKASQRVSEKAREAITNIEPLYWGLENEECEAFNAVDKLYYELSDFVNNFSALVNEAEAAINA